MTTTLELVSYTLKNQVLPTDLATVNNAVNDFLLQQPGFIYRSCSADDKAVIFDVVYWQDEQSAKRAGDAFIAHPAGQALIALCDEHSVEMRQMALLSSSCSQSA
ncbi:hypothetical protein [Pseudoalteromonas tunicata]|jgi:hypothetical protein|uniref:ABM domain-containing protein n=1 Tax=Pseudoalteromonas tunicata D2 TaxID=87626 RepID=A4C3H0_9GAMM|nr:hypothetical protein [Pseudoalteromonas tunicata]ATC96617.1 hypothetical protein PTUN_b0177 [Pseudoalteromonas tunicata]AXT32796.1 hypothetical protein D1819_18255 [Pseudoalteromonas tunicata]EAR30102.1 hypothetical protein PTD2_00996 [Pseudoalteromonas tunicata D2]